MPRRKVDGDPARGEPRPDRGRPAGVAKRADRWRAAGPGGSEIQVTRRQRAGRGSTTRRGPRGHDVRAPGCRSCASPGSSAALARGDGNFSQMHYARRGEITEEMRFVAMRENVAPEFVRDEVARGRAIIPANINHPELEPMIIGRNFLVKINANIGNSAVTSSIEEEVEKLQLGDALGRRHGDGPLDRARTSTRRASGSCATRRCRSARCRSTRPREGRRAGPRSSTSTSSSRRSIEQAEQGVDYFTIHAGVLLRYIPLTREARDRHRLARRLDHGEVVPRPPQGELPLHRVRATSAR